MDRGRSPSPPSSSLLSPIRPTVPTVPTFASSSSQFLRSENSTLLQKINHHKNVSNKLQLENKQLKEKVNELTKLVDAFNSARLIATPVSSDVESFFAREEYEEVLMRETEQRIRLNDEAANKENDEKEEQKEKEQLRKSPPSPLLSTLKTSLSTSTALNQKLQTDLSAVIHDNASHLSTLSTLKSTISSLKKSLKTVTSENVSLKRQNSELQLELKLSPPSPSSSISALELENASLREWAESATESKRITLLHNIELIEQLKALTNSEEKVGDVVGGRKIVFRKTRERFIVKAKGEKDVKIDLKGDGVKVFKWKFSVLGGDSIKFTILSPTILHTSTSSSSAGEVDVISDEVVCRFENLENWIRPVSVGVEEFRGEVEIEEVEGEM
ncbi:hypothetical protein TrST_g8739 [Triparma strigata]|uniref:Uncharacterized protein n=1 Tax=Triparma strigata TaxID=1606541 RepID=A0A9W6ZYN6_9STRA|nr:hypothetical protein TrST_g8739 [Triparma strigata]